MWKYFGITHTDHTVMNPMSLAKTKELIDLLRLPDGGRVLDVACGKAEFLCLVAERYEVTGTGIDLSPFTYEEARKNVAARQLTNRIDLLNMDGGKYELDQPRSLDMASCIGASWVYQGHKRTLEALKEMVRPGGLVLAGEPFWKIPPEPEYLKLTEQKAESYGSHSINVQAGVALVRHRVFSRRLGQVRGTPVAGCRKIRGSSSRRSGQRGAPQYHVQKPRRLPAVGA